MVSCSPIFLHSRTGKRAQLSVPKNFSWAITPSGTMYALTASCTVATQKAPKHYIQPDNFTTFSGIPLNPDHLRSRGHFAPQMATQRPTQAYSRKMNTIQTTVGNPYQLKLCVSARLGSEYSILGYSSTECRWIYVCDEPRWLSLRISRSLDLLFACPRGCETTDNTRTIKEAIRQPGGVSRR